KNIDTTLFKHLINASKIIHDQVFKDIKKYGLTYENLMVLECLYHHGPHYIQVLSDKLYIPSGSITYIVNKLEKKSLVRREIQSYNKRYCKVFITDEGERSEEHTSELQSRFDLVCRLLLEKKKKDRRD